jgi:hypothetical protein
MEPVTARRTERPETVPTKLPPDRPRACLESSLSRPPRLHPHLWRCLVPRSA